MQRNSLLNGDKWSTAITESPANFTVRFYCSIKKNARRDSDLGEYSALEGTKTGKQRIPET